MSIYENFDPVWRRKTFPPPLRYYGPSNVHKSKIYEFCGTSKTVLIYDPLSDEWETRTENVPDMFAGASSASVGDLIYVYGVGNRAALYSFEPEANIWTELASPPAPHNPYNTAIAIEDKIYILGGRSSNSPVLIYETSSNTWFAGASNPGLFTNAAGAAVGSNIYIFGGESPVSVYDTLYIYNTELDEWSQGPSMPRKMFMFGAASLGDAICIIGSNSMKPEESFMIYDTVEGNYYVYSYGPSIGQSSRCHIVDNRIYLVDKHSLWICKTELEPGSDSDMYVLMKVPERSLISASKQKSDILTTPTRPASSLLP